MVRRPGLVAASPRSTWGALPLALVEALPQSVIRFYGRSDGLSSDPGTLPGAVLQSPGRYESITGRGGQQQRGDHLERLVPVRAGALRRSDEANAGGRAGGGGAVADPGDDVGRVGARAPPGPA